MTRSNTVIGWKGCTKPPQNDCVCVSLKFTNCAIHVEVHADGPDQTRTTTEMRTDA